ncbi:MAG: molybdenum cofactor biosynthesis protein B [Acidiferrobacterales bacterium]
METSTAQTKPAEHVHSKKERNFIPVNIAVLTISDTRTEDTDRSGQMLANRLGEAGHKLSDKVIVPDDIYRIRATVSQWIVDENIQAVITTGGTGVTGRDGTPEAVRPLLDKEIEGFGEMFRAISYDEINTSTLQSRALAGVANGTYIFCLPGSSGACKTGWDRLIQAQLDNRTRPCNLVETMPRLREV